MDDFLLSIKEHLSDLPDYYLKLVDENFDKYIKYKYEQGYSLTRINNALGDSQEIADRYKFFYKLHQIHGKRALKGSKTLLNEALKHKFLSWQLYSSENYKFVFKSIFMVILGILLSIMGLMFFVGNLDNPWGLPVSVITISIFMFTAGLGSIYYIVILRHKFHNEMLSVAMDGCKLDYFGQ